MSARRKKGRAQKSVRPDWWEQPTFYTYADSREINGQKRHRVELILPDATRVNLGYLPAEANSNELRYLVGLQFKEIWDPKKNQRRTPTT